MFQGESTSPRSLSPLIWYFPDPGSRTLQGDGVQLSLGVFSRCRCRLAVGLSGGPATRRCLLFHLHILGGRGRWWFLFPSAGRWFRLVRAAAPRRALLLHGARGRGLVRRPRPGPRVNPGTRNQERSRACTQARARVGPHDDGAAANPFPALGLLGNARPRGLMAESTKGKEINSRSAG